MKNLTNSIKNTFLNIKANPLHSFLSTLAFIIAEAAMFSAQIVAVNGRTFKAEMNRENARYNHQLLLNIIQNNINTV